VLPVKRFGRAKSRLGPVDRASLAEAMVGDVMAALAQVDELEVLVVSCEPRVESSVDDPVEAGHNSAALLGIREAMARGAERVLLVPGDCPALNPAELRDLLATEEPVAIVPDRHGTGTNALLLAPPDRFVPSFGPGSFERHRALAAGAPVRVATPPSLTHDVDTLDDLRALDALGGAPRTRALLARLDLAA
jgi:2-phospho-L-lactate guanylyltransferase